MRVFATYTVVGSDYFSALGLRILAGRDFTHAEEQQERGTGVAIVDQALAARVFGSRSPLGESLRIGGWLDGQDEQVQIVGVAPSVRDDPLSAESPRVYVPFGARFRPEMTLHVRTDPGGEASLVPRVREAIEEVDARLPILSAHTLTEHRDGSGALLGVRVAAMAFGAFGAIALLLASLGVYGLRAYLVAQRTREFAVRLALGSTRTSMLRQLLGEGMRIGVAGVIGGAFLAALSTSLLLQSGLLYEVRVADPLVLTGAPLLLLAATCLASYVPARRATRIEPAIVLKK